MFNMRKDQFIPVHTAIDDAEMNGFHTLRVVKKDKLAEPDENTYARLRDVRFHDGVIEAKLLSRLLPDAPSHARGFIGIAFRINDDDSAFESFYLRPTNGRTDDPERKKHACQYFSYPTYTFSYFRERNIEDYESPVDIGLDEWIDLKAVISGAHGTFYVNGERVLDVPEMKLGADAKGAVGFFVDIGTEAFYRDLRITPAD